MKEGRPVVVPFERPAAYWATKARRHDTPARRPDAVRLMRKALEKSGDPKLAMELFRMYADMECHTAAERCLATAAARGGLTGDICFGIGCCALNRGEETLAEKALEASLRLSPGGMYAEQAQDLLETYPWQDTDFPPRGARGEVLLGRAQRALAAGNIDDALIWARRAWKKSHSPRIALLLGALLPTERAMILLNWASRKMPGRQQPYLMLALACHKAGQGEMAYQALMMAYLLCGPYHQAEAFCLTAWEMGVPEIALSLIDMRLAAAPASADYLRLRYLCLKRMGENEKAGRALSALLEIDPDDAGGLWYRRHPQDVQLMPARPLMLHALAARVYSLPDRLQAGPLNRILHLMVMLLSSQVEPQIIYKLLPSLWNKLSPAEKRACDEEHHPHYPLSFWLYLLLRTGQFDIARDGLAHTKGKRRALRALKRYMQWMKKE